MLRPRKGYENTEIEYRVGQATIRIKASDITREHIERAKHYCDLSAYVEEVVIEYDPKRHDAETIIQEYINQDSLEMLTELNSPKKTRKPRKKK
jgi:hypothetical protein